MSQPGLTIGFARRGFSLSGGAESYLKRLARGVVDAGHRAHFFTTHDWPSSEWEFGPITHFRAGSAISFADDLLRSQSENTCDVLMSLERVWRCDIFRAGDGVHRAWLEQRAKFESPWQRFTHAFTPKHRDLLRLEEALLTQGGAGRVIANSQIVREEIARFYNYPRAKIDLVRNGVDAKSFRPNAAVRETERAALGLSPQEVALLFVGSGWERKGLRFAIQAVEARGDPNLRLLIVGRGNQRRFASRSARFLGVLRDLRPVLAAADIFILPTIYDPFSNASLEALAAGLPVITTRANGCSEITEHNVHGSIIDDPRDIHAISNAVQYWSDLERRRNAQARILERAAQFDISTNVAQTLEILLQAAESAPSTSGKMRKT